MEEQEYHQKEKSGDNLEKIGVKPLLYYSSLVTLILFIITCVPFFNSKYTPFLILPFFLFYIYLYLFIMVIVFFILIMIYRDKAINMEIFSDVKILGFKPITLVNRTGIRYIDIAGLFIGIVIFIITLLSPSIYIISPGVLLLTLSFLFALFSGKSNKWSLKRRETFK